VAGVLLTEYLALSVVAAAIGLVIGRATAPLFTSPGSGLLGSPGSPEVTRPTVAIVLAAALAVTTLATLVPALRAARTSTVSALAGTARTPRRRARLLAWSTRLPVPIQLAGWLAARRPRRVALATLSIAVTVSGVVAILYAHASLAVSQLSTVTGSPNPGRFDVGFIAQSARENRLLLLVTVMLGALAGVNAIFITQATVRDGWHTSAVSRALGATPGQITAALSACQVGPAFVGSLVGIAGGLGFFTVASQGGAVSQPPAWWLLVAVLATVALIAILTAMPARLAVRVSVARQLQAGQ
jgi:ABC-type antimicrobial peptide transport system permease subunit